MARQRVIVVGGGIAGLVAAHTAAGDGADVTLVERHGLGGRGRVDDRNGYRFNRGPRALYRGGPAERILRSLGVEVRSGGAPRPRGPLTISAGEAHRLVAAAVTPSAIRQLLPLLRDPGPIDPTCTLTAWLDRRGARGEGRALLEAFVRLATYADAPDVLPAGDALAQARAATRPGVRYLDGGFGAIVDHLGAGLAPAGIERWDAAVRAVEPGAEGWQVRADDGTRPADAVVLAVGGPDAAVRVLGERPEAWATLGPPAHAACLELGVRRVPRHRLVLGLDEPTYLSVHAPPADLAPRGHAVVHVMRYRQAGDGLDHREVRAGLHRVATLAGIDPADVAEERYLDRMEVTGALPTAAAGGLAGRPAVEVPGPPGRYVAGDWVGPEGMLLDAAVASAAAAGARAAQPCATMAGT